MKTIRTIKKGFLFRTEYDYDYPPDRANMMEFELLRDDFGKPISVSWRDNQEKLIIEYKFFGDIYIFTYEDCILKRLLIYSNLG